MNPLNAAAALMSRLTYAQKFLLLGLVLLAPAGFALNAYWDVQGETLAFADSERAGVRFVAPANELAVRVVQARGAAVQAAAGKPAELAQAVAAVNDAVKAVDAADGAAIGTDETWQKTRAVVLEAATDAGRRLAEGRLRQPTRRRRRPRSRSWSRPATGPS